MTTLLNTIFESFCDYIHLTKRNSELRKTLLRIRGPVEEFEVSESQNFERLQSNSTVLECRPHYMLCRVTADQFSKAFPDWSSMVKAQGKDLNEDKVNEIVDDVYLKLPSLRIVNQHILIGTVRGQNPIILDGMHRLSALMKITTETEFLVTLCDYPSDVVRQLDLVTIKS